jgi:hypothetical protein
MHYSYMLKEIQEDIGGNGRSDSRAALRRR